jgi:phage host-nuclease inhibitor protein Gam
MSPSRPTPAVSETSEAINRRLLQLGRVTFRLEHLRAEMDEQVNRARKPYVERIERIEADITEQEAALEGAVAGARADLMPGRSKTASFAFGTVYYRTTPPAVKLLRGLEPEDVAATLLRLKYDALVRYRAEPNLPVIKEALAAGQVSGTVLKSAGILVVPGAERFGCRLERTEIEKVGGS